MSRPIHVLILGNGEVAKVMSSFLEGRCLISFCIKLIRAHHQAIAHRLVDDTSINVTCLTIGKQIDLFVLVMIASIILTAGVFPVDKAFSEVKAYPRKARLIIAEATNEANIQQLVLNQDLVVRYVLKEMCKRFHGDSAHCSLLPTATNVVVAKACIQQRVHLVTASYSNEELDSLHQVAYNAGITIINELGLDPGLEQMTALKVNLLFVLF